MEMVGGGVCVVVVGGVGGDLAALHWQWNGRPVFNVVMLSCKFAFAWLENLFMHVKRFGTGPNKNTLNLSLEFFPPSVSVLSIQHNVNHVILARSLCVLRDTFMENLVHDIDSFIYS